MSNHDVIIIGGGPAGLSAALYLARANLKPLVIAGDPPGGQLMLTSEIENFPGTKPMMGAELVGLMREQAEHFGAILLNTNVTKVDFKNTLNIETDASSDNVYQARAVLISTGAKALWMGLESETRLRGKGVSACATCDGFFFRNKDVAIVGGGDTALEEALQLTKFASKVYLIHRRDTFKASRIMQERVFDNTKIEVIWNSQIKEILGEQKVEGIQLIDNTGATRHIQLSGVFVAIGHKPDTDLFENVVLRDERGYILTMNKVAERIFRGKTTHEDTPMKKQADPYYSSETSVHGVFGAGDCVDDIYRQASTASGMGVVAAMDIERFLEAKG